MKCDKASPKHLEAASWRRLYQIASQSFHRGVLKCSEASEADANCSFFVFVFLFKPASLFRSEQFLYILLEIFTHPMGVGVEGEGYWLSCYL